MATQPQPFAIGPGEGETVEGPAGGPLTFKVRGERSGGALLALENVIAPGDGPPLHRHEREDEAWYVIEGDLSFQLGEEITAAPGARFAPGENTFSATPLAWSHSQLIRLAHSIDAGAPVETPQVVACRYATTLCRP